MSILSRNKPGTRVLILQDVRDGAPATGQYGTLEGDFPVEAYLYLSETENGSVPWDVYQTSFMMDLNGIERPMKEAIPLWEGGQPKPNYPFAIASTNPRIRLADGSPIWGYECWWRPANDDETVTVAQLEDETNQLEQHKNRLCAAIQGDSDAQAELFSEIIKKVISDFPNSESETDQLETSAGNDK